ncbi:MAG TPA: PilN domain-containing protein [Bryobacteraceae bacterium]|jgi:Tfp pilus assembly protein PilN|nr:PilN domain-containing protein [Bryobacteraceae bacterium]
MIPASLNKFLAFGSGVGIEITGSRGSETLRITAVRVRPTGARMLGSFSIENAAQQPAAEWGQAYAGFLKKLGLNHVVATVLLPREDVILRQISVPGVSDKDLEAAVGFQMDGLHPYAEDDVVSSWARLPGTTTVLVAIARKAALERYSAWFSEAGIKVSSFTCAPAAIYSARRLFAPAPVPSVLAMEEVNGRVELYGESPSHPLFSAAFDATPERAIALACAELRLDPAMTEVRSFHALVGAEPPLSYAAALAGACSHLFLPLNLLPVEMRASSSRALWIPTGVAAGLALMAAAALAAYPAFEDRRYLRTLNAEIAKVRPQAAVAAKLDKDIETDRQRTILLDQLRKRSKMDIDVVGEMTRVLPPPIWLNTLEITRTQVTVAGETDQAAPLLKQIDASPFFEASEFAMQPMRTATGGEMFRIRSNREAGK